MLSDEDIGKLCHGRIIYAPFYRSDGKDAAGPHYAVILDSDEQIKEHDSYYVVVISNKEDIDDFVFIHGSRLPGRSLIDTPAA